MRLLDELLEQDVQGDLSDEEATEVHRQLAILWDQKSLVLAEKVDAVRAIEATGTWPPVVGF